MRQTPIPYRPTVLRSCVTLFAKCFSPFGRPTCVLSVPCDMYSFYLLAWQRFTCPREAAIPNSQTRSIVERAPRRGSGAGGGRDFHPQRYAVPDNFPSRHRPPRFASTSHSQQRSGFRTASTGLWRGRSRLRVHSPLLMQSQLLSFPALGEML